MSHYQIIGTAANQNCITGADNHFYSHLQAAIRWVVKFVRNLPHRSV